MCWQFRNRKVTTLIVFGLLVHGLVLNAVFDIYFSSPIDHGMTPIRSTYNPPAKRLVLFVADGLRAEAIFGENMEEKAPNLMNIRNTRGSWGVAHTRVPTESRPGHVALLGGVYEDPAAILKGWKSNPVDFDSVVNQSTNAWCWGGPSIINMLNKDNLSHIHLESYDSSMEDFGTQDTIFLDRWVFNKVQTFIKKQTACKNCTEFRNSGSLFFLHLLGIDTAGHGYKPLSKEYTNNIKFLDEQIPEIEQLFENTFPDRSTAYVFTADHGMTNWGSHGAGSDHETETPIIAWGAGIKQDQNRKDINQIDIAPLISALLGIKYPINSLGKLPYEYIETSMSVLSEMLISNVRQLMETFNVKRYRRMQNSFTFVPFQGITSQDLDDKLNQLNNFVEWKQYNLLKEHCNKFMDVLIEGADYYHNYYQLPLLISITIGIVAWIIYLATFNVRVNETEQLSDLLYYIHVFLFGMLYSSALVILKVLSLPVMYYLYFLFPIYMIQVLVKRYLYIIETLKLIKRHGFKDTAMTIASYGLWLKLLVSVFHIQQALSALLLLVGASVWFLEPISTRAADRKKGPWFLGCTFLALFPFYNNMHTSFNLYSHLCGYFLWWILIDKIAIRLDTNPRFRSPVAKAITIQCMIFKFTPFYTLAVECGLIPSNSVFKNIAWIWSLCPIILIPCSKTNVFVRLTSIFIGFATFYQMVTLNHESLFLIFYVALLLTWLILEAPRTADIYITRYNRRLETNDHVTSDDFRQAFIFIVLIFLGFFGTGNITSLSSFDPMWVRCFLTVFSPFRMTALILLRIMVPFIFATCVYRAINIIRKVNTLNMFCIVLLYSDVMLLELLYSIKNIGSWLEIGTSLSQFIIMEAFVLILLLLYYIAYLLTTVSYSLNLRYFK